MSKRRIAVFFAALLLSFCVSGTQIAFAGFGAEGEDARFNAWADAQKDVMVPSADGPSGRDKSRPSGGGTPMDVFVTSRAWGKDSQHGCTDLYPDSGLSAACAIGNITCQLRDVLAEPGEGFLTTETVRIDNRSGQATEELLGFDCQQRGGASAAGSEPVVITVTQEDFASMPVEPLVASAGPPDGWLPVNMVNVLYAESAPQTLEMELLGTPVQVRAMPVLYEWDLGDGNTISTTNPGEAYPSEAVSSTYRYEGWYDVTLTTTFSGQFSVAGEPWQDIDGTIEVASEPVEIYSKSLESRLVNPDVPADEDEDPWVPARSPVTEGRQDPEATHREI